MSSDGIFRGGATRASLKHSFGMIALRLIVPLAMRHENRERKQYLKEHSRYEKHVREQQRAEAEPHPQADPDGPAPPSKTMDGTADRVPTPEGRRRQFARRLCSAASKLKPGGLSRRRGGARRNDTVIPMEPPRHIPHWHGARPKPTPAYMKPKSQPVGSHPYVPRSRARRKAAARAGASRDGSSSCARSATSTETQGPSGQATVPHVINREEMPARYRHTNPY